MQQETLDAALQAYDAPDPRRMNPLQMAYIGDTVHDLYVRTLLVAGGMSVGAMHRQAVRMVSAAAQARMLESIESELTCEEADVVRRGRNAHPKHAVPRHAEPADYARATGLEALWGYLYVTGQTQRLGVLVATALERTEDVWRG